ncbi:MAG: hypothetical protein K2K16_05880 [Ruminococcus sp.]|nr:hypothetical protein [Ruminococcus sp.]
MITVETIVNAFISTDNHISVLYKLYGENRKTYTPFEKFKNGISEFYRYTGNDTDFKSCYSFETFANFFYDAVCYDEELPEYIQEKFIIYFKRPEKTEIDKEYINSVLHEIRAYIVKSKLDEAVKDFWINDNDRKTKKVRELIFRPHPECNSATLVSPVITWAENHNRMTYEFIYKIFEYGYITGKRDERARKKTI